MDIDRFDMIDAIMALDIDKGQISCRSTLPTTAKVYEGHFPGYPLTPGTVQTEIMAQAAGILCLAKLGASRMPFLIGIEHARFRRELRPGSIVEASAQLTYANGLMAAFDCTLASEGTAVAQASVRLSLTVYPEGELRTYVDRLLTRLGVLAVPEVTP